MITAYWLMLFFLLLLILVAFGSLAGWIIEGMRLEKQREENRLNRFEIDRLKGIISRRNILDNIRTADEYSKSLEDSE